MGIKILEKYVKKRERVRIDDNRRLHGLSRKDVKSVQKLAKSPPTAANIKKLKQITAKAKKFNPSGGHDWGQVSMKDRRGVLPHIYRKITGQKRSR